MGDAGTEQVRRARKTAKAPVAGSVASLVLLTVQIGLYGVAVAPCILIARPLAAQWGAVWGWSVGVAAGIHLGAVGFILAVAGLRKCLGGNVKPGVYRLHSREARRWLRNLGIYEIARRSPFFSYVHHYPFLTVIFYRLMGAEMGWGVRLGKDASVSDPWLTQIGSGATVGESALVLGHFIRGGSLVLGRSVVEEGATVGVQAVVSPGSVVGVGATLGACSFLPPDRAVPPGERWVGAPAAPIGARAR